MARKKYTNRLINKDDINEEIRLINGSSTDYISENGNVYKEYESSKFIQKKVIENPLNHYGYCGITMNNEDHNKSKRVHKLVAEAFLEKDPEKPIVGHKDNNKMNNCVDNLYWTTVSENTQKAFDDGLAKNDKGFEDSQSISVIALNMDENYLKVYGSISECAKDLGIHKFRVSCNSKESKKKPYKGFCFYRNN